MITKTQKNRLAIAAGAALLIGGCASAPKTEQQPKPSASDSDMGQCHGVNSCKGSGSCATSNNSCAGENSCKGKGWLPLTKSDCDSRSRKFTGFKKS